MNPILAALIKLDQVAFQVITLGRAKKGETISAASYNAYLTGAPWGYRGWVYRTIDTVAELLGDRNHCRDAWEWQKDLYK